MSRINELSSCSHPKPNIGAAEGAQLPDLNPQQESWYSSITSACQARVKTAVDTITAATEQCVTAQLEEEKELIVSVRELRAEFCQEARKLEEFGDSSGNLTEGGSTRPTSSQLPGNEEIPTFAGVELMSETASPALVNAEGDVIVSALVGPEASSIVPLSDPMERSVHEDQVCEPARRRASSVVRGFRAAHKLGEKWMDRLSKSRLVQDARDAWAEAADFSQAPPPVGSPSRGRQRLPPLPRGASFRPPRGPQSVATIAPVGREAVAPSMTPATTTTTPRRRFALSRGRTIEMSYRSEFREEPNKQTELDGKHPPPPQDATTLRRPPSAGSQFRQNMQLSHYLCSPAVARISLQPPVTPSRDEARNETGGFANSDSSAHPPVLLNDKHPGAAEGGLSKTELAPSPARTTLKAAATNNEEKTPKSSISDDVHDVPNEPAASALPKAEVGDSENKETTSETARKPASDDGEGSFSMECPDALDEGSMAFSLSVGPCSSIGSTIGSDAGDTLLEAMIVGQVARGGMDLATSTVCRPIPSGLAKPSAAPVSKIRDADVNKALRAGIGQKRADGLRVEETRSATASDAHTRRCRPNVFVGHPDPKGDNYKTHEELVERIRSKLSKGNTEMTLSLKSTRRGVEMKPPQTTLHSRLKNLPGAILLVEPCVVAGLGANRESVAKAIAGEVNKGAVSEALSSKEPAMLSGRKDLPLVIFAALGINRMRTNAEFFATHMVDATWERVIAHSEPQSIVYSGTPSPLQMWGIWQSLRQLAKADTDMPPNCRATFVGSYLVLIALRNLDAHMPLVVDLNLSDHSMFGACPRPQSGIVFEPSQRCRPTSVALDITGGGGYHQLHTMGAPISLLDMQSENSLRLSTFPVELSRNEVASDVATEEEFKHIQNLIQVEPGENDHGAEQINAERFDAVYQYIAAAIHQSPRRRKLGYEIALQAWGKYRYDREAGRLIQDVLGQFTAPPRD